MIGKLIPTRAANLSTYCSMKWTDLTPTDNEKMRFCSLCSTNVYACDSLSEIESHQRNLDCISFETYTFLIKVPFIQPFKMMQVYGGRGTTATVDFYQQCKKGDSI